MTTKDFFDRYGVTMAIVGALAALLILLPGNARNDSSSVDVGQGGAVVDVQGQDGVPTDGGTIATGSGGIDGTPGQPGSGTSAAGGASASGTGGARPVTGGAAGATETVDKALCRDDSRMNGISRYMPPCMGFTSGYTGKNGGATAQGVTGDKIKLVLFRAQADPATTAILTGAKLADEPEDVDRIYAALVRYSNLHYQTWGREVVAEWYDASGPSDNDEAMKADAVKIAQDIKPFALIGGPKVMAEELAQRKVICICTVTLSSDFYMKNPPYIFGSLPTNTEYAIHIAEYMAKRLNGKPAKWAGDENNPTQNFKTTTRKFGLIYIEGANGRVDPEGRKFRNFFVAELAKYNIKLAAESSYLYDPGRNQQDMTNMMATMKSSGVTTIIGVVDPLSPIFITQEATRQAYYPEWLQTGTGLSDTTAAGRLYDQTQWSHSFGISPLWVTWLEKSMSTGSREYYHARPDDPAGREGNLIDIYRAPVQTVFRGVQMAGPKLTPDTFVQGQYNYPKTGGTATAPLVYLTRQFPTEIKDFVEIYYDINQRGKDERGEEGNGMIMKVDGGKRFQMGEWPRGDPKVFDPTGALAVTGDPKFLDPPHEKDGHKHPANKKCLSCG